VRSLLEDLILEARTQEPGDYTTSLGSKSGCAGFRDRLRELKSKLGTAAPTEMAELRAALRAITTDGNAMKHELLGASP